MHTDSLATIFTISQCTADETERRRLVAISRSNLKKLNVTGCLFWTGRFFGHVLEGTSRQLAKALTAPCNGGRLSSPKVVLQTRIETREFGAAPLAFVPVPDFDEVVSGVYEGVGGSHAARVLVALLIGEYLEQLPPGDDPGAAEAIETAEA